MTRTNKLKIGILGTGGMANLHAGAYKDIRGVELTACMDVNAQRAREFADTHGFKHALTTEGDLLDAVDALSIVTPDKFHVPMAIRALRAGKHILCEKPLALSLPEARKAARAAAKASGSRASGGGVIHMINFSYRNSAAFHHAAKLVADGKLGEIRHVHSRYLQQWLTANQWGNWTQEKFLWRLQTAAGSGGVLGDIGCHLLDFTTGIAGDLKALGCRLHTFKKLDPDKGEYVSSYRGKRLNANDTALIEMAFEDGAVGQAQTTRWATGRANSLALEVHGTEGALAIDLDDDYNHIRTCLGKARHKPEWKKRVLKPTPNIYQRFVRSIKTGINDQPDLLRGAQIQAYLDACERSAKDGGKMVRIRKSGSV